jgi:ATP-binding cassette, subfamily B, bacterial PglK
MYKLLGLLYEIWRKLSSRRRWQFAILLVMMFAGSFAEIFSIGALLPFLGLLTSPERVFSNSIVKTIAMAAGIGSAEALILPAAIVFCLAILAANGLRLLILYATTRYSFAVGADISFEIYQRTLHQPYRIHVSRNSSEVISGITGKSAMVIGSVLVPMLAFTSASIILVGVFSALIVMDPMLAIGMTIVFGLVYLGILFFARNLLSRNSEVISSQSTQVMKAIQEGLGGIRDVLIDGTQHVYQDLYLRADRPLRRAQANNNIISAAPRFIIEPIGITFIVILAISLGQREGGLIASIPLLGAIALGAQRLLPVGQQAYSSIATIAGSEAIIEDVIEMLEQPLAQYDTELVIPFEQSVTLKDVGFAYAAEAGFSLKGIGLTILKGQKIGVLGTTGSGKSTLMDIMMALLEPTSGDILIDGRALDGDSRRAWQKHIAHVPQSIFLSDTSVAENIAFGVRKEAIDFDRVRFAAESAKVADTIDQLPEKYDTMVGERGVRLSGGQRQRIGIARALYKNADFLILDEATSALDNETEAKVMSVLDELDEKLTVLIVAHRLSTLRRCDLVVEMENGEIKRMGTYAEIIENAELRA